MDAWVKKIGIRAPEIGQPIPIVTEIGLRSRSLREIRRERGLKQRELAETIGKDPMRVSEIESRGISQTIKAVQSYIEGLGGRMKIIAEFDDAPPTELHDFSSVSKGRS